MRGDEVLLISSRKTPGAWILPAGTAERGETLRETALREVREEAGVACVVARDLGAFADDAKLVRTTFYVMRVATSYAEWEDRDRGRLRRWWRARDASPRLKARDREALAAYLASGAAGELVGSILRAPSEAAKTRVQSGAAEGAAEAAAQVLFDAEGRANTARAWTASLLRDVPMGAIKAEQSAAAFAMWHKAVVGSVAPERLLVLDVFTTPSDELWRQLCAFVGKPLPREPGGELPPFPLRTGGRILSAVLVLDLRPAWAALVLAEHAGDTEPHLVFSSFDGHVYIVHATTGCAHKIDVGEHAYAQILADDLTGNGRMDLLLSTMNGNLYCFETSTPFAPLRAWRAAGQGRNGFAQIERTQGIAIGGDAGRHAPRAVSGATMQYSSGSVATTLNSTARIPPRTRKRSFLRTGR